MIRTIAAIALFAIILGPFIADYADWRAFAVAAVIGVLYALVHNKSDGDNDGN